MSITTIAMVVVASSFPTRELGRRHRNLHHHGDAKEILVLWTADAKAKQCCVAKLTLE
jgi:hypothetical protein